MKRGNVIQEENSYRNVILFVCGILLLICGILLLGGCATEKHQVRVSKFHCFSCDGEEFRIRSVYSDHNGMSYNELIGPYFVAKDLDQNGIIDHIEIGDAVLKDVQRVYEEGIAYLTHNQKIRQSKGVLRLFTYSVGMHDYQVISFQSGEEEFFNEFKIVRRNLYKNEISILKDQGADGHLDEVLKGDLPIEEAQAKYIEMLEKGLENGKLIRQGDMVLVKNHVI